MPSLRRNRPADKLNEDRDGNRSGSRNENTGGWP